MFELGENVLPSKVMAYDIFYKAIDVFVKSMLHMGRKETIVSLYGGETLANKKIIKEIIPVFGNEYLGVKLHWVINTNGSLLKEEDVIFFKKHNVEIHISVDGKEEIHNISRPTHKGKGTFHMVIPALEFIKKHQAPAQINSYMMPSNYLHLEDIVDIANEYGIKKIYLDQFYNLDMISHKVGMEIYRKTYFYALSRGISINGPWGRVVKNYHRNRARLDQLKYSLSLDVNIDGSCYVPLLSSETKKMNLTLENWLPFIENGGWDKIINLCKNRNESLCDGCSIKEHCYGAAIEQVHYHIGDHADHSVSCNFFRDWIGFLTRPIYFIKTKNITTISFYPKAEAQPFIDKIQTEIEFLEKKLWPLKKNITLNLVEHFDELVASSGVTSLPPWVVAVTVGESKFCHRTLNLTPALKHELTHLFIAQKNVAWPKWLKEGFCEWIQQTELSKENLLKESKSLNLYKLLQENGEEIDLIKFDQRKPGENVLYGQSQLFVQYLMRTLGEERFLTDSEDKNEESKLNTANLNESLAKFNSMLLHDPQQLFEHD